MAFLESPGVRYGRDHQCGSQSRRKAGETRQASAERVRRDCRRRGRGHRPSCGGRCGCTDRLLARPPGRDSRPRWRPHWASRGSLTRRLFRDEPGMHRKTRSTIDVSVSRPSSLGKEETRVVTVAAERTRNNRGWQSNPSTLTARPRTSSASKTDSTPSH